jgi:hypothetical protein
MPWAPAHFAQLNYAFTVFFAIELIINAFANWFRPFITNGPWHLAQPLSIVFVKQGRKRFVMKSVRWGRNEEGSEVAFMKDSD